MESTVDRADMKPSSGGDSSGDYTPYPKLTPEDVAPPPPPSVAAAAAAAPTAGQRDAAASAGAAAPPPVTSNPYVTSTVLPSSKNTMDTVRDVLGKFGKKVEEVAKKTENLAGNFVQHLKTGPSVADAAMGRITQITKVIAEGGYEKIFQQTFETLPDEKLKRSYACYLSTSAGPVMGVLYLSTAKLAFCSDSPLSYKVGDEIQWSLYKVAVPLQQLRSVNHTTSKINPGEKYIQVVSTDNHEFWFMGFVNYDSAVKYLTEAVQGARSQPL